MSQLLGRVAKLSSAVKKQRLCFSELRSFSTSATPYLIFSDTNQRRESGGVMVDMNLYDPRKDERVKVPDQTLSEELKCSVKMGSSRGWVVLRNVFDSTLHITNIYNPCASASSHKMGSSRGWFVLRNVVDSTLHLTNIYNPCASASSHKVINLPRFNDSEPYIANISLSASPNQQDCVVAAKSCLPFISLCRPGDSVWTHFKVPFYASKVTYSMRDSKFYLYWGGKQSSDLIECETSSSGFPEVSLYQIFPNSDIPESRRDQISSSMNTPYLVESPNSGDSFIVYWCNEYFRLKEGEPESCNGKKPPPYRGKRTSFRSKPRTFVVFRQDREQGIGSYTEDIGDLCIFLSQREAFCVSATEYPGLHPNCVYYASFRTGYGYYDLSSNTLHDVIGEDPLPCNSMWLAPLQ